MRENPRSSRDDDINSDFVTDPAGGLPFAVTGADRIKHKIAVIGRHFERSCFDQCTAV